MAPFQVTQDIALKGENLLFSGRKLKQCMNILMLSLAMTLEEMTALTLLPDIYQHPFLSHPSFFSMEYIWLIGWFVLRKR